MTDNWLEIGKIVSPQGLQGKVKVSSLNNLGEILEQSGEFYLQHSQNSTLETIEILSSYQIPGKNLYLITIAGIEDRNQAAALRGCKILIQESEIILASEDEYYISQLINLEVYHQETGENIGVVNSVFYAGNDLLEIKLHQQPTAVESSKSKSKKDKQKKLKPVTVLIPFVKEIVPIVDLETRRIEIQPPEGLLDLNVN